MLMIVRPLLGSLDIQVHSAFLIPNVPLLWIRCFILEDTKVHISAQPAID